MARGLLLGILSDGEPGEKQFGARGRGGWRCESGGDRAVFASLESERDRAACGVCQPGLFTGREERLKTIA